MFCDGCGNVTETEGKCLDLVDDDADGRTDILRTDEHEDSKSNVEGEGGGVWRGAQRTDGRRQRRLQWPQPLGDGANNHLTSYCCEQKFHSFQVQISLVERTTLGKC